MCQHLEMLPNTLNHYFPNDQGIMLQSYALVKDPSRVQDRWMDFGANEYKNGVCMACGTTSQWSFMKLPLVRFWGIKE